MDEFDETVEWFRAQGFHNIANALEHTRAVSDRQAIKEWAVAKAATYEEREFPTAEESRRLKD